jgi:hypothetical protein
MGRGAYRQLLLKLGLRVSPRTIRKYLPARLLPGRGKRVTTQRWQTFVRNHAQAIVACDFCVVARPILGGLHHVSHAC